MPLNAVGQQGSWFACYKRVRYPCVHDHYIDYVARHYCDPDPDNRIDTDYVDAIGGGRVLVTASKPDGSRDRYKGLFEVSNVRWRNGELHFDLLRRLA